MVDDTARRRSHKDYTIACICPMGIELAPVEGMLDETHDTLPGNRDQNAYSLGSIGGHNVVIAVMPAIGTNSAAAVAIQLLNDFPCVRFGLLVGIGGGVPGDADVRLGDVVVSQPTDAFGGVVQYDLGKRQADGTFRRTGQLDKPPAVLSESVIKLERQHRDQGQKLSQFMLEMIEKNPIMRFTYELPKTEDRLFLKSYLHRSGKTCDGCDMAQTVDRPSRHSKQPQIHYGTIGSANTVLKDAMIRDELRKDMGLLCVEMEAAGLMNNFPCLVIRGVCDYADSHKNKEWQPYAAAVAAAYMKEVLLTIPANQVLQSPCAVETVLPDYRQYNNHSSGQQFNFENMTGTQNFNFGVTDKLRQLHWQQGKLKAAAQKPSSAPAGREMVLGTTHCLALDTDSEPSGAYSSQGLTGAMHG